jgi:hypothetical protein
MFGAKPGGAADKQKRLLERVRAARTASVMPVVDQRERSVPTNDLRVDRDLAQLRRGAIRQHSFSAPLLPISLSGLTPDGDEHDDDAVLLHWDMEGRTVVTPDCVRLTPHASSVAGALWNREPLTLTDGFTIRLGFTIHGDGTGLGGDGLALWFAERRPPSLGAAGSDDAALGFPSAADVGLGFGVLIDTHDNDRKGDNPHVAVVRLSSQESQVAPLDPDSDFSERRVDGCRRRGLRAVPFRAGGTASARRAHLAAAMQHLTVTYRPLTRQLSVSFDDQLCAVVENIDAPAGGYLGLTARTGLLYDAHDINYVFVSGPHDAPADGAAIGHDEGEFSREDDAAARVRWTGVESEDVVAALGSQSQGGSGTASASQDVESP